MEVEEKPKRLKFNFFKKPSAESAKIVTENELETDYSYRAYNEYVDRDSVLVGIKEFPNEYLGEIVEIFPERQSLEAGVAVPRTNKEPAALEPNDRGSKRMSTFHVTNKTHFEVTVTKNPFETSLLDPEKSVDSIYYDVFDENINYEHGSDASILQGNQYALPNEVIKKQTVNQLTPSPFASALDSDDKLILENETYISGSSFATDLMQANSVDSSDHPDPNFGNDSNIHSQSVPKKSSSILTSGILTTGAQQQMVNHSAEPGKMEQEVNRTFPVTTTFARNYPAHRQPNKRHLVMIDSEIYSGWDSADASCDQEEFVDCFTEDIISTDNETNNLSQEKTSEIKEINSKVLKNFSRNGEINFDSNQVKVSFKEKGLDKPIDKENLHISSGHPDSAMVSLLVMKDPNSLHPDDEIEKQILSGKFSMLHAMDNNMIDKTVRFSPVLPTKQDAIIASRSSHKKVVKQNTRLPEKSPNLLKQIFTSKPPSKSKLSRLEISDPTLTYVSPNSTNVISQSIPIKDKTNSTSQELSIDLALEAANLIKHDSNVQSDMKLISPTTLKSESSTVINELPIVNNLNSSEISNDLPNIKSNSIDNLTFNFNHPLNPSKYAEANSESPKLFPGLKTSSSAHNLSTHRVTAASSIDPEKLPTKYKKKEQQSSSKGFFKKKKKTDKTKGSLDSILDQDIQNNNPSNNTSRRESWNWKSSTLAVFFKKSGSKSQLANSQVTLNGKSKSPLPYKRHGNTAFHFDIEIPEQENKDKRLSANDTLQSAFSSNKLYQKSASYANVHSVHSPKSVYSTNSVPSGPHQKAESDPNSYELPITPTEIYEQKKSADEPNKLTDGPKQTTTKKEVSLSLNKPFNSGLPASKSSTLPLNKPTHPAPKIVGCIKKETNSLVNIGSIDTNEKLVTPIDSHTVTSKSNSDAESHELVEEKVHNSNMTEKIDLKVKRSRSYGTSSGSTRSPNVKSEKLGQSFDDKMMSKRNPMSRTNTIKVFLTRKDSSDPGGVDKKRHSMESNESCNSEPSKILLYKSKSADRPPFIETHHYVKRSMSEPKSKHKQLERVASTKPLTADQSAKMAPILADHMRKHNQIVCKESGVQLDFQRRSIRETNGNTDDDDDDEDGVIITDHYDNFQDEQSVFQEDGDDESGLISHSKGGGQRNYDRSLRPSVSLDSTESGNLKDKLSSSSRIASSSDGRESHQMRPRSISFEGTVDVREFPVSHYRPKTEKMIAEAVKLRKQQEEAKALQQVASNAAQASRNYDEDEQQNLKNKMEMKKYPVMVSKLPAGKNSQPGLAVSEDKLIKNPIYQSVSAKYTNIDRQKQMMYQKQVPIYGDNIASYEDAMIHEGLGEKYSIHSNYNEAIQNNAARTTTDYGKQSTRILNNQVVNNISPTPMSKIPNAQFDLHGNSTQAHDSLNKIIRPSEESVLKSGKFSGENLSTHRCNHPDHEPAEFQHYQVVPPSSPLYYRQLHNISPTDEERERFKQLYSDQVYYPIDIGTKFPVPLSHQEMQMHMIPPITGKFNRTPPLYQPPAAFSHFPFSPTMNPLLYQATQDPPMMQTHQITRPTLSSSSNIYYGNSRRSIPNIGSPYRSPNQLLSPLQQQALLQRQHQQKQQQQMQQLQYQQHVQYQLASGYPRYNPAMHLLPPGQVQHYREHPSLSAHHSYESYRIGSPHPATPLIYQNQHLQQHLLKSKAGYLNDERKAKTNATQSTVYDWLSNRLAKEPPEIQSHYIRSMQTPKAVPYQGHLSGAMDIPITHIRRNSESSYFIPSNYGVNPPNYGVTPPNPNAVNRFGRTISTRAQNRLHQPVIVEEDQRIELEHQDQHHQKHQDLQHQKIQELQHLKHQDQQHQKHQELQYQQHQDQQQQKHRHQQQKQQQQSPKQLQQQENILPQQEPNQLLQKKSSRHLTVPTAQHHRRHKQHKQQPQDTPKQEQTEEQSQQQQLRQQKLDQHHQKLQKQLQQQNERQLQLQLKQQKIEQEKLLHQEHLLQQKEQEQQMMQQPQQSQQFVDDDTLDTNNATDLVEVSQGFLFSDCLILSAFFLDVFPWRFMIVLINIDVFSDATNGRITRKTKLFL